jgi:peroxiredoxin
VKKIFAFCCISLCLCAMAKSEPTMLRSVKEHLDADYPPFTVVLPALESAEEYAYLGLKGQEGEVSFSDLSEKVVIFSVFSMYCPHCQKDAPRVNQLYEAIEQEGLSELIKIIGVANRNSFFEANLFKDKYAVPFPIIADKHLLLSKQLVKKQVGTPFYVVIYIDSDGMGYVFYTRSGSLGEPDDFLNSINSTLAIF